jgi:regulator of sigma E protease
VIDVLFTVGWFLLVLIILVTFHEFGHFVVARRCGVQVLRFSVGFGKPLWRWYDRQGTEFAIAAIPLGGYVKMLDEREGEVPEDQLHRAFNRKSVGQRMAIAAAGPIANFLLAIVLFWGLFLQGTTGIAPVIGAVEPDSVAARAGLEAGQEIVAVDGVKTPTRHAVLKQLMLRLGETGDVRFTLRYPDSEFYYESEASLVDWLKDVEEPDPVAGIGISFYRPVLGKTIDTVVSGSPAERAGFEVGDELLSVDGLALPDWREWVDYVRDRPNQALNVVVLRDGAELPLTVTPESAEAEGALIGRVGMSVQMPSWPEDMLREEHYTITGALVQSLDETLESVHFVLVSVQKLFLGEISTKNLSGPIGIAKVAGDSARAGAEYYIQFLAMLSVYLAVFNLLPIPVLDGGHILYCAVEAIKGSPVSERIQTLGYQAGLVMLFGVMVLAFYNDILRL